MQLSCIHCGRSFTITASQLGGRGRCPHCRGEIELPKGGHDPAAAAPPEGGRFHWLENSVSALGSAVIHMVAFLVIVLLMGLYVGGSPGIGPGTEVSIGTLPEAALEDHTEDNLLESQDVQEQAESLEDVLEPQSPLASETSVEADLLISPVAAIGGDSQSFNVGAVAIGGTAGGGDWESTITSLRRNGLDIVIVFDSTGSMGGEIREVKAQIHRLGSALTNLIPKTRIGIATYRDTTDSYVVKGLPLTSDIQEVESYLADIHAGGGGDEPEAVDRGLQWAVDNNDFKPSARKVILLFGDAPPHDKGDPRPELRGGFEKCLQIASDFRGQGNGVVSTVTCHSPDRLSEFIEIAQQGGGEAFLTRDEKQIMTQLLVLVFGSRHRGKVLEAFKLLEE